MMKENLSGDLNPSQSAAVRYIDGPSLVIAGAGSGKTRVLTYKIAYLLQQGYRPWSILALTFTNKAAKEMKERIGRIVGRKEADQLCMGTFHSIFSRILRIEARAIGYTSAYTIYDEADSRSLIKAIVKEKGLNDKIYKPAVVHHHISMAKNRLLLPEAYARDREAMAEAQRSHIPALSDIYTSYCVRCRKANAMDFDDLLVLTYMLFRDHDEIRRKYESRFDFVLVDEYQDTNYAQLCILLQLTRDKQHVCVVGDDSQSIYSFRGANIDNILNFNQHFHDARLFKLEQNYRSTQHIVQAANSLIKHNEKQIPKEVYSKNAAGEKVMLRPAYSDKEEALIVCHEIKRIREKETLEWGDFAILYRTNSQSRSFEEEMRREEIPYHIVGGLSFYQRKEIKDIIAYFRMVVNPDDEEAFKRIINYPSRGIGATTVGKISTVAREHAVSFWSVINDPVRFGLTVNKGTLNKLDDFRNFISKYIQKSPTHDAYVLGSELIKESGISAEIFSGADPEAVARQENLEEFVGGMKDFVDDRKEEGQDTRTGLSDYLQEVSLLTDLDSEDKDGGSRVNLMTIHSAKGLEFPTVFVVGLEENIFPSPLSACSPRELEEERRLLYVAITRAEKHCILTYARNRWRYGNMTIDGPSRFIQDIDPDLLDVETEAVESGHPSFSHGGSDWKGYEPNRPYTGYHDWGNGGSGYGSKMQNSHPVASQFRADPKPRVTAPLHAENAVDPLSASFKRHLVESGGNLRRVSKAMVNGGRTKEESSVYEVSEGDMIEHQRFGVGKVIKVEGKGENTKATVEFKNSGTKQLLLKFAKFKIIE
jgi:DNA helicase-2/ATP-dependent DNA helicase PcrA